MLVPLFACWTLALLPLQSRRPRPRLRMLARRPGFATVLVVSLLSLRCLSEPAIWHVFNHQTFGLKLDLWSLGHSLTLFPNRLVGIGDPAGFAVASTWFALALARWWRPEPSWIDRTGRLLGWCWIASFAVSCYERAAG